MTRYPDLFEALVAPFDDGQVKVLTKSGRQMPYITARTAMNRLDTVLGPENWWDSYAPAEHSVQCALSIRLPDGQVLTKCDAGGNAGMADEGDDDKSGYSDAFKRAAVKFGVARYLYRDGVPDYRVAAPAPSREPGADDGPIPAATPPQVLAAIRNTPGLPVTGKALYRWACNRKEASGQDVVKWLQVWGKSHDCPPRMVDWSADQVALGWDAATRKLETLAGQSNGAH